MLEIPGFRYDAIIKNYVPILLDTPGNRALNLVTASNIIKHERINTLEHQTRLSKKNIARYREVIYPCLRGPLVNVYNVYKMQQTGIHDITNDKMINMKRMKFCDPVKLEIDNEEELNAYHNVYKSFPPNFNSQLIVSSYSSSPYKVHHSLHKIHYTRSTGDSLKSHSSLIKHFDILGGVKLSVDRKKITLVNRKEFSIIDTDSLTDINSKFNRELPMEMCHPFDTADRLLIGVNSKKRMTHLDTHDLSTTDARCITLKCDWESKWVFRDVVFDANGENVFLVLRGRMGDSSECILKHDLRCPIPSRKNVPRLSLQFRQNASVTVTRVPHYSDLLVTHCYDGQCALWDMRWKDRPAVIFRDIAPGRPDIPIDIDPTAQFVTMSDNDNIVRIFNLKTGLVLFSEKQIIHDDPSKHIFSFFNQTGLYCRPTLLSNFSPNVVQIRHLNF